MPMLELGDCQMYYSVKGEGPAIAFIHPPLLTSANFAFQVEELSKDCTVITFDIRGHGRSSHSEQELTYPLIAADLLCLLDHLKIDQAYICGYSTGGSITLEFLLNYAQRSLGGIIVSGMPEVSDTYNEQRIKLARRLAKWGAVRLMAFGVSWGNSDSKGIFKKMYQESLQGSSSNIAQYYHASLHYNCTSQLHTINRPVLLVFGEKDKAFHPYAAMLHERLPKNELKFVYEKHQIPTKSPQQLNQLIRQFIFSETKGHP